MLLVMAMGLVSGPLPAQTSCCESPSSSSSSSSDAPNILGTAAGTFSSFLSMCEAEEDDGSNSGNLILNFIDQQGHDFSGEGSGNDRFGSFSLTFSGSVFGSSISVDILAIGAEGEETQLFGSGTFSGGVIELSFFGQDISGDTCIVSDGRATLTFSSDAFNPLTSSPVEGTIVNDLFTATRRDVNVIQSRLRNRRAGNLGLSQIDGQGVMLSGEVNGAAAGDDITMPLGVWASYVRTDAKNDFSSTANKSTINSVFAGVDFEFWGNALIGVALGMEDGSTKTRFNNGKEDITGFTVAPYFAVTFTDVLSADLSGGVSQVSIDQYRTSLTGARIESDTDAWRYFVAGNLNATYQWGPVLLTGSGGLLYSHQDVDSFTETNGNRVDDIDATLGQFRLGGELAYVAGSFEPYFSALYSYDFTRTELNFAPGVLRPSGDDDDIQLGFGLRYFGDNGLSGSLEYSTLLNRDNYDEDVFTASVRWNFK